ncbi:MAG: PaaI family thioesterase [Acidimicrobiales bacterium]
MEHTESNWVEHLGLEWDEQSATRMRAHVEMGAKHHQPYGIVHGGAWASIVETVASYGAAMAAIEMGSAGVVGVSNTTDFLRSHKEGRVDVVGTPVFVGRTQQLWTVEISRPSDSKLVARGQVRLQNLTVLPQER